MSAPWPAPASPAWSTMLRTTRHPSLALASNHLKIRARHLTCSPVRLAPGTAAPCHHPRHRLAAKTTLPRSPTIQSCPTCSTLDANHGCSSSHDRSSRPTSSLPPGAPRGGGRLPALSKLLHPLVHNGIGFVPTLTGVSGTLLGGASGTFPLTSLASASECFFARVGWMTSLHNRPCGHFQRMGVPVT